MKEKIDQYAKGIFEYDPPDIVLSPTELQITVNAGEVYQGSFMVTNSERRMMKGIVCTDHHDLLLGNEAFHDKENEIAFRFRGTNYQPGETIRGMIQILSDLGRMQMPFVVSVAVPSCETSSGKIRDLRQFADLARENPDEALRLFYAPHFEDVLLAGHEKQIELYRGLARRNDWNLSGGRQAALEEFLISVHKKLQIQLSLDRQELQYPRCEKSFADKLVLHKDTWGYGKYEITSDASFIRLNHSYFQTSDFVGDSYEASFVVDVDAMAFGHNFARITITGAHQTLEAEIIARKYCVSDEERRERIEVQKDVGQIYQSFLFYQAGRISEADYIRSIEKLTCSMDSLSRKESSYDWLLRAARIQLALLRHQEEVFHAEMSGLEDELPYLKKEQPLLYASYYYLLYLWKPEAATRADAVKCLRECYQSREHHWLILWFLLQMDSAYQSGSKCQGDILEQLQEGACSPVLYMELCRLYDKNPELLVELASGNEQALHWGCRNRFLSVDLKRRYAYLISRQRRFSLLLFTDLCQMYEEEPGDDLLMMICQMLMRDRRVSADDLKWYQLGIEHGIKLTELYECYMDALEKSPNVEIPEKVLLYFSYGNQLAVSKKALLYAYIIRHKEMDRRTYDTYAPVMREFAEEQLSQERISRDLAVIYEEFIREEDLEEELAYHLPPILFAREITCLEPSITEVVVRHAELVQEERVPLVKGKAIVSIFTEGARIFLVDKEGNRYASSIDYTVQQLLHMEHLAVKCFSYAGDHVRLLLYLYDRAENLNESGKDIVELRKRVLEISGLSTEYRQKIFAVQMSYYYENFEGELLDYQLKKMDWEQVAPEERGRFIEYCAVRHIYEKGMEGILQYGYDHLDAKRLLQISSLVFDRTKEENASLVKLAWYIFSHGQFDAGLLKYLCDYYSGGIPEMLQIWNAAYGFGIDVLSLAERILAQILFTNEMSEKAYPVFFFYEQHGHHKRLIRAFMKWSAYRYLIWGHELPEQLFESFYENVQVEENFPCLLAALKWMSGKAQLTGGETVFADYNVHQLYEKGIVPAFFQRFYGKISLPDRILKEQYIEYVADPAHEVKIHYQYMSGERKGKSFTGVMPDIFEGLRTCGFVLFQDEVLEYTIIEEGADGTKQQTELRYLQYTDRMTSADGINAYRLLNKMMKMVERGDYDKLLDYMWQYAGMKEAIKMLICPLEDNR